MAFAIEHILEQKFKLQITVFVLALLGFILAIARLASRGATRTRMDTWLVVVVSKSPAKGTISIAKKLHSASNPWLCFRMNS